jgi:hypothetical protein
MALMEWETHTDAEGRTAGRPKPLPDAVGRARAFVAEVIADCAERGISSADVQANPEHFLQPLASKQSLIVKVIASGKELDVVVLAVGTEEP